MNARKAIKDLVQRNFRAKLSNEEAGELLLLLSYEIEANLRRTGIHELVRNTFDRYMRQRKLSVIYN
ncbi:MAG: hypothetical protein K1X63_01960 [Chitinophagales bacterium]|jgi:hypothetical protein|nr:hypothetical protein [Bacteroidota bacterium]MBX7139817.1 hypothetical protein [Chitinophagales bacterium]